MFMDERHLVMDLDLDDDAPDDALDDDAPDDALDALDDGPEETTWEWDGERWRRVA
jgi:hypothetical protein